MQILIKPEELVRLCLWDNYSYYIVGSDKEAEKILHLNKEFEISERDAMVVGLLKIMETTNLIHKFNSYISDFLINKSVNNDSQTLVKKKILELAIDKFLDKFPDYWVPTEDYKASLTDLIKYIDNFKLKIDKLVIQKMTDQFGTYEVYTSNSIKKLLTFNF